VSQSPYQPPMPGQYAYAPAPPDLTKPSRRAGLLTMILGICVLLLGLGIGAASVRPAADWPPEIQPQIEQFEAQSHWSWNLFLQVTAVVLIVPGVVMIVLGIFVRRAGIVSALITLVLAAIILFNLVPVFFSAIYQATFGNQLGAVPAIFFCGAAIGLFGLQIFWLAKSIINAGPLKMFNAQQQAYAWQMYQHQQAYGQQQQQQFPYPPPPPPPGS